ncbi:MAG: carboxymuconolactone decarboxylase family protein, partial [Saprospiraceae bacterium]|nr:carboxymuconolactone decarboxylase family protein [Saprospiraceae bacterium]
SKDDVRDYYDAMIKDYVLGPPFMLHAVNPPLMSASWILVRESLIVKGHVNRLTKEAIAGGVAISNQCPFCVEAHINMSGGKTSYEDRRLFDWSKHHYDVDHEIIKNPPFGKEEAPEILGTVLAFHYINRMVSAFVTDYPLPLPDFLAFMKPVISSFFKMTASKNLINVRAQPGEFPEKLPMKGISAQFAWSLRSPYIGTSFTSFNYIIAQHGQHVIPDNVRQRTIEFFQNWNGEQYGVSNQWLIQATEGFSDVNREIAQLVLLSGIQAYKISEARLFKLRNMGISDHDLVTITAWGAWQAVKKINSWISTPFLDR